MGDDSARQVMYVVDQIALAWHARKSLQNGTWYPDIRQAGDTVDAMDAAYIAAASPAVVLALIDEVEELRATVEQAKEDA